MKVVCVTRRPSFEQLRRLRFDRRSKHEYYVTPGKVYTVLGMTFLSGSGALGSGVALHLVDDHDRWSLAPLCIFNVVDPCLSHHWTAHKLDDADLGLWPEPFCRDFFFEDLADGDPQALATFERVRAEIEDEVGVEGPEALTAP